MKLYVSYYYYECGSGTIIGIYSTREAAEESLRDNFHLGDGRGIYEGDLDEVWEATV